MACFVIPLLGNLAFCESSPAPLLCPLTDENGTYDPFRVCNATNDSMKVAIRVEALGSVVIKDPSGVCYKITNSGSDVFFIPNGGVSNNRVFKDFQQYVNADGSTSNLAKSLVLSVQTPYNCSVLCNTTLQSTGFYLASDINTSNLCNNSHLVDIPHDVGNNHWGWSCADYGNAVDFHDGCFAQMKTDGHCGDATKGSNLTSPPSSALCQDSTEHPVVTTDLVNLKYTWSCNGKFGGIPDNSCQVSMAPGKWTFSVAGTCTPTCTSSCSAPDTYVCDHNAPNGPGNCQGLAPSTATTYPQVTGPSCAPAVQGICCKATFTSGSISTHFAQDLDDFDSSTGKYFCGASFNDTFQSNPNAATSIIELPGVDIANCNCKAQGFRSRCN